jgi:hypothetical protein
VLGLKFKEAYTATDPLEVTQTHFITRELAAQKMGRMDASGEFRNRLWVEPKQAKVLVSQGQHPRLTLNQLKGDASGIWVGVPAVQAFLDEAGRSSFSLMQQRTGIRQGGIHASSDRPDDAWKEAWLRWRARHAATGHARERCVCTGDQ